MIEECYLREDNAKYHGDDEEVHRIRLEIKLRDPTAFETDLLLNLMQEFLVKIRADTK